MGAGGGACHPVKKKKKEYNSVYSHYPAVLGIIRIWTIPICVGWEAQNYNYWCSFENRAKICIFTPDHMMLYYNTTVNRWIPLFVHVY